MTREALDDLNREIIACGCCSNLVEYRVSVAGGDASYWSRPVPGFGDADARLYVAGLAPGAHGANRTGRVFTGDSAGEWLVRALYRAGFANQAESVGTDDGLELQGAYVGNIVRCAVPDNQPQRGERAACMPYTRRELGLLEHVKVVVAFGETVHKDICDAAGLRPSPRFRHMAETALPGGRTLLSAFHPNQQTDSLGRLTEDRFDAVLARARELINADSA